MLSSHQKSLIRTVIRYCYGHQAKLTFSQVVQRFCFEAGETPVLSPLTTNLALQVTKSYPAETQDKTKQPLCFSV